MRHHFPDSDPRRLAVVPHGVDHDRFKPMPLAPAQVTARGHGLKPPYLLQLGSWLPHKNLELSINAFAQSRTRKEGYRLAFVGGGASSHYHETLIQLTRSHGLESLVDWVEDVPAHDVPPVLAAAACLLQPSKYEGFAMPVVEAMAVGTPGIVSDSTCLPEVAGGAWPVSGQNDAATFAKGIDDIVLDPNRRAAAIAAGIRRAAEFTWEASARKTLTFFKRILELEATESVRSRASDSI
jgi:glycosyltransferase involved in cell wall biosynthesis